MTAKRKSKSQKPPAPSSEILWRITVNDTYNSFTYEIRGTDNASIRDVMDAARGLLRGTLVREWCGELKDDPSATKKQAK